MWGDQAVGKLVSGADILKPGVAVFVDDEAGSEVAAKVERRLQHFIDRKIAAAFEPLLGLQNDDALTGIAKGFALAKDLAEFPEAPPPGLVTVPSDKGAAPGYYAMAGYRAAGDRAIRIDMLERLADMLRDQDSRGGFEGTADMLSITGMTLDQFADLMAECRQPPRGASAKSAWRQTAWQR